MIKHSSNRFRKVFNDVNAIYSYILTPREIKKLSDDIIKLIQARSNNKSREIQETDILLITYADTFIEKKKKSFNILNDFLNTFLKDSINIVHILPFYPSSSDGGFAVTNFI